MLTNNRFRIVSAIIILATILVLPSVAFANEGSKFRECTDMPDENQKNACLAQLSAGAEEACAQEANKDQCKNDFMYGKGESQVVEAETKRARNTCETWDDCPLMSNYVTPAINALSGAVGIVVVTMIVWGGIRYTSSRDNPQQAATAKEHIRNALFALVIYIFMIAFLNWVVPGGVF